MKSRHLSATVAGLAITLTLATPAAAQQHSSHPGATGQSGSGQPMMQGGQMMMGQSNDPASQDYHAAMQKMHQGMMTHPMSGDADRDFVMMMLPHHQAAIDMAKAQLKHGKDPELRKMSETMIKDQEKDIAELNEWMSKHKK